ncbi:MULTISPECIES: ABC transporter substrate-binding protein [Thermoanaerobacter]|uniref:ABC-type glycerol-3-phosphate transport system substrate-binding protein n=1 Tax=Thermoanaerobacter pentosaceus TaxID=694059 RepID=A0ABT9M793_9THEO|nr:MULTISPECIES: ABC transporter substrate-binding protein [Thermoanaerobacter]MDP9752006.1 ABC-type glycerol-3-phosphate transport system substrate-binding protein [Thermoanaerobacter pentosaceus]
MRRIIALITIVIMVVGLLSGCGQNSQTGQSESTQPKEKVLKIWSFTNEAKVFATAFKEKHPDVKIEFTMIPMTEGEYQLKLKSALQSGEGPDVVALESDFVREFVESDYLVDLSDLLPFAEEVKTYQFTIDIGTDENGVVKAFSYQATPGLMYYRRSLAKKYFGTDDPVKIQELVSDLSKFEEAAKIVKEKSNGNTYMIASTADLGRVIIENRDKPWIVDSKLVIDPKVEELFDIAKNFRQNGYEAQATQWQESWFAGMNDSLVDAKGNPKQIFAYFLPTWGLSYVLQPNSAPAKGESDGGKTAGKDTSGDWAAIPGPMPYRWGGTWFGVTKDSENVELAKEFIKFVTLNEETLKSWALGVYTNEYLKKIDPSIGDELQQPAGDFVSSQKVVEEIASQFGNTSAAKFLGGQNPYEVFAEAARRIDLGGRTKNIQATDFVVQDALWDPLDAYASGEISKDEALKRFKEAVKNALPDVNVD